jgi:hypothetical protein
VQCRLIKCSSTSAVQVSLLTQLPRMNLLACTETKTKTVYKSLARRTQHMAAAKV